MSKLRIRIPDLPVGSGLSAAPSQPAHYKRDSGPCRRKAPCGHPCSCSAKYKHVYHSCHRKECEACHGAQRFQKASGG